MLLNSAAEAFRLFLLFRQNVYTH